MISCPTMTAINKLKQILWLACLILKEFNVNRCIPIFSHPPIHIVNWNQFHLPVPLACLQNWILQVQFWLLQSLRILCHDWHILKDHLLIIHVQTLFWLLIIHVQTLFWASLPLIVFWPINTLLNSVNVEAISSADNCCDTTFKMTFRPTILSSSNMLWTYKRKERKKDTVLSVYITEQKYLLTNLILNFNICWFGTTYIYASIWSLQIL